MQTSVEICNSALTLLGANVILSLDDATSEGRACKNNYDFCRRSLLRAHPWNFAITRVVLAPLASPTPSFEFENFFSLPSDCLRIIQVDDGDTPHKIEGKRIACDSDEIELIYLSNVTDTSQFDVLFSEALALYLAWKIAYQLTQSAETRDSMWLMYQKVVAKARFVDAVENPLETIEADAFLSARTGRGGFVRDPGT